MLGVEFAQMLNEMQDAKRQEMEEKQQRRVAKQVKKSQDSNHCYSGPINASFKSMLFEFDLNK